MDAHFVPSAAFDGGLAGCVNETGALGLAVAQPDLVGIAGITPECSIEPVQAVPAAQLCGETQVVPGTWSATGSPPPGALQLGAQGEVVPALPVVQGNYVVKVEPLKVTSALIEP